MGMAELTASLTVTTKVTSELGADDSVLLEGNISMKAGPSAPADVPSAVTTTCKILPSASTICKAAVPDFNAETVSVVPLIAPVTTRESVLVTEYGWAPPPTLKDKVLPALIDSVAGAVVNKSSDDEPATVTATLKVEPPESRMLIVAAPKPTAETFMEVPDKFTDATRLSLDVAV